jgi:GNAT superfamily N-acetyltransferase
MGSEVTIERRRPGDADEIFRLYGDVFGQQLTVGSRRRWDWQYLENPVEREAGPAIWVARDGETVLGQYASMPVRLWWGAGEVRSSWGMDVFLRPEARGRGIGARLFNTWSEAVDVALGLGLTPSSYGLFKKLGYHDVGPVPFYRRILDARAVASRRVGRPLGQVAGPVLRTALRLFQPERSGTAGAVSVRPGEGFGPEYDRLWESARGSWAMCVRRDAAYLDWKYRRCPHRRYDLWEARRGGTLAGYAVSRHEDYRGLRLGWIVDLFGEEGDAATQDALLSTVLRSFHQARVARAQCFALSASLGEALERRGFRAGTSPMQFCVTAQVDSHKVLADRSRWHVVFGDSDMDR